MATGVEPTTPLTQNVTRLPIKNSEVEDDEYDIARVVHDYTPRREDSNAIPLERNGIVFVFDKHESGWWAGESNGRYGIFPSAYVMEEYHVKLDKKQPMPNGATLTQDDTKTYNEDEDDSDDDSDDTDREEPESFRPTSTYNIQFDMTREGEEESKLKPAANERPANESAVLHCTVNKHAITEPHTNEGADNKGGRVDNALDAASIMSELEAARGERNNLAQEIVGLHSKIKAGNASAKNTDSTDYSSIIEQLRVELKEEVATRQNITVQLELVVSEVEKVRAELAVERSSKVAHIAPPNESERIGRSGDYTSLVKQLEAEKSLRIRLEQDLQQLKIAVTNQPRPNSDEHLTKLQHEVQTEREARLKLEQDIAKISASRKEGQHTDNSQSLIQNLTQQLETERKARTKLEQDVAKLLANPAASSNQDVVKQLEAEKAARVKLEQDFQHFVSTVERDLSTIKRERGPDSPTSSEQSPPSRPLANVGPRPNVNIRNRGLVKMPSTPAVSTTVTPTAPTTPTIPSSTIPSSTIPSSTIPSPTIPSPTTQAPPTTPTTPSLKTPTTPTLTSTPTTPASTAPTTNTATAPIASPVLAAKPLPATPAREKGDGTTQEAGDGAKKNTFKFPLKSIGRDLSR